MSDSDRKIRERAHALWEQEGRPHGRHEEHWEQARREIEEAASGAPAKKASRGAPAAKSARTPAEPAKSQAEGPAAKTEKKAPSTRKGAATKPRATKAES